MMHKYRITKQWNHRRTAALAVIAALSMLLPLLFMNGGLEQAKDPGHRLETVSSDSGDNPVRTSVERPIESNDSESLTEEEASFQPQVSVYLTKEKRVETLSLERYIIGVLAAEMPIEFELEALKAQAIAARTYIVRRVVNEDRKGVPVPDAIVTDTVQHQAYLSEAKLKDKWSGEEARRNLAKLVRAVVETRNLVLTYDGEPIEALFFSTSNGYTENSEDYWGNYVPYLRSVDSPWDMQLAPRYKETVSIDKGHFYKQLGLRSDVPASASMKVIETTTGHRIKKVKIGGKLFTGREVREKLGLNSSQFTWDFHGDEVKLTTVGYGHGVGMSQWGANGMALAGNKAEEILKHYYSGVQLEKASNIVAGL